MSRRAIFPAAELEAEVGLEVPTMFGVKAADDLEATMADLVNRREALVTQCINRALP
jgi:hypothetical protein